MRAETCEELQKIVGEDLLQSPQLRFPSSAKVQTGRFPLPHRTRPAVSVTICSTCPVRTCEPQSSLEQSGSLPATGLLGGYLVPQYRIRRVN
ncbi:hypothetical protein F2Q68_00037996 [Brassica cretica]|uniref:Uncharacterized protein n=1 Tax=Brassica cretica TaxID=69181 RepID=A0A8S9H3Z5_BRACR|nr:hypothetical protein F2Q68_00037996 [Brassica cretica]